jgi:hypothetical protein
VKGNRLLGATEKTEKTEKTENTEKIVLTDGQYIIVRNDGDGLNPSRRPAVHLRRDEAVAEAVRRLLENGGQYVVFKAITAFEPKAHELKPEEMI